MTGPPVAVIGASGFIGSQISRAFERRGLDALAVVAPRFTLAAERLGDLESDDLVPDDERITGLAEALRGTGVVVNAAGIADSGSADEGALLGANALLPRAVLVAARLAGVRRMIHISSAGVQGRIRCLDESATTAPVSPYTRSKALGERAVRDAGEVTVFRPTSVHGAGRSTTMALVRFLASPLASVAGTGEAPTPQVLVENVADAVVTTALADGAPKFVLQPAEGLTVAELSRTLGGHEPIHVPRTVASALIRLTYAVSGRRVLSPAAARRLEMLWFGQAQVNCWLTTDGLWQPVVGREGWLRIAQGAWGRRS